MGSDLGLWTEINKSIESKSPSVLWVSLGSTDCDVGAWAPGTWDQGSKGQAAPAHLSLGSWGGHACGTWPPARRAAAGRPPGGPGSARRCAPAAAAARARWSRRPARAAPAPARACWGFLRALERASICMHLALRLILLGWHTAEHTLRVPRACVPGCADLKETKHAFCRKPHLSTPCPQQGLTCNPGKHMFCAYAQHM